MKCPPCGGAMIVLELDNIEIDYCASCRGVWLDAGEIERLLESAEAKEDLMRTFSKAKTCREKLKRCPICLKKMRKFQYGGDSKVTVDVCRRKHGIWFDEGELDKVLAMGGFDERNKIVNVLKGIFKKKGG
jgi:Zn-finger nucleic acid-binding protein